MNQNIVMEGDYGIHGGGTTQGEGNLRAYTDGPFENNVILKGGVREIRYPVNNEKVAVTAASVYNDADKTLNPAYSSARVPPAGPDMVKLKEMVPF